MSESKRQKELERLLEIERAALDAVELMGWRTTALVELRYLGAPHAGNRLADLLASGGDK